MYLMGHLKSISKVCVYIWMLFLTILDRIKTKQKANEGKTKYLPQWKSPPHSILVSDLKH